jgi:hypothetical protein
LFFFRKWVRFRRNLVPFLPFAKTQQTFLQRLCRSRSNLLSLPWCLNFWSGFSS